jgi:hypothetical protein
MNTTLPTRDDDLDRLLSRFLKAQMPDPWPAAPVAHSEPSALAAARAPLAPRNVDPGRRARYTLAASVALVLGTCWAFSNGFRPGDRPGGGPAAGAGDVLDMGKGTANLKDGPLGAVKNATEKAGGADAGDDPLELGKGN